MRTTIRIHDDLYRQVKAEAALTGRTIGQLIEDAVRLSLRREAPNGDLPAMPVYGGSGTLPGVDINDSRALRDLMDEGLPLHELR